MAEAVILSAQQKMALMTMESQAKQKTSLDFFNEFTKMGLSQEGVTAFKELSLKTAKDITGRTIEIGKIIIIKILDFINKNTGASIGVLIGTAIAVLVSTIPFLGPLLAGIGFFASMIVGHRIDKELGGKETGSFIENLSEDIVTLAKEFFQLLKEIFTAIFDPIKAEEESAHNKIVKQKREDLELAQSIHQVENHRELLLLQKEITVETDLEKVKLLQRKIESLQQSLSIVSSVSNQNSNSNANTNAINITNVSSNNNANSATSKSGDDTYNTTYNSVMGNKNKG